MATQPGEFRIKVYKQNFNFDSAHFITFMGKCETLHGHNYHVEVEIEGGIGSDDYVLDFSDIKPLVRRICSSLDHKVLLAAENRHLSFRQENGEIEVRFQAKRYVFPLNEVVLVPIANTTAELLSFYIAQQIKTELAARGVRTENLSAIEVGVEEAPGQRAYYRERW